MRYTYIILFLLFIASAAQAQTAAEFYKKASVLAEKGDYKNALVQMNNALKKDSVNIDYLSAKAHILRELKEYQASYDTYSAVIGLSPKTSYAYNNRGLLLYSIQQFDASIDDFTEGLKVETRDSMRNMLLLNRAASKIYKRDFNAAYDDLMTIYKNDSLNIGMLTNLASICDEIGKGDMTLVYLEKVVKQDPGNYPAYGNIGFKYQEMGDHKKAIEYFNKVLEIEPKEPLGYSNRSFNKLKTGDIKGAYADIEKSLQLYPTNSYAYRIRALIYLQENKTAKACVDLDKALQLGFTGMFGDEVEKLKTKHCPK